MRKTVLILLALAVLPASAEARPDALAGSVSNPPSALTEGGTFTATDGARVSGGKAGGAVVRYYLSADGKHDLGDLRLTGRRSLGRKGGRAKLGVPYTVAPGALHLLACADDTGKLREKSERDNCAASKGTTRVTAAEKDRSVPKTLADLKVLPDSDELFLDLAGFDKRECPAPNRRGVPSLKAALKKARAKLDKAGGAQGRRLFKASSASRSADGAEDAAGRAIAAGQPGGALQALLAAHRMEPKEPAHLVNAAGIMASTGMPREALALLRAADGLEPRRRATPYGINTQAVALNARGYALLQLGRYADAEPYLRAAVKLDPYFSEAKTNLGIALLCKGDDTGLRFARAGQYRFLGDAVVEGEDPTKPPPPESQIEVLDLSGGTQPIIPQFKLPKSVDDAAVLRDQYVALQQEFLGRSQQRNQRISDLIAQQPALNSLSEQRYLDLKGVLVGIPFRSDVAALRQALLDRQSEIGRWEDETFEGFLPNSRFPTWQREAQEACKDAPDQPQCEKREYFARCRAPITSAHGHWLGLMDAQLRDYAALVRLYYPLATGVVANISDPSRHEADSLGIDDLVDSQFNTWISTYTGFWANLVRLTQCWEDPAAPGPPGSAMPDTPHSEPCSEFLRGVKFAWKVEKDSELGIPFDFSIEVNCEKINVEVSGRVAGSKDNWIGAFGEVSYMPATGKVTIFGGPKASGKIPGTSIGGSIKDGLYVTISNEGVTDAGFRVSPTVQAGLDQFSIKGGKSLDFSFAPVFGVER